MFDAVVGGEFGKLGVEVGADSAGGGGEVLFLGSRTRSSGRKHATNVPITYKAEFKHARMPLASTSCWIFFVLIAKLS